MFLPRIKRIFWVCLLAILVLYVLNRPTDPKDAPLPDPVFWEFRSVDTMKYSRDLAREKLADPSFDAVIEKQVSDIASTGASHVAIGVPYEDEFVPVAARWVAAARRHGLNVWFRGNAAGWEGWFGYPSISRAEHIRKIERYIASNPDLFADGDIFSACPECENGGPGDPRATGDVVGHRQFLIDEHRAASQAFAEIGKAVDTRYNSMNGDVARLVMDRETTSALGGLIVVDHYVSSTGKLASDIRDFAERSGGRVVLGEFGAPIPDLHGSLSAQQQAEWLGQALDRLAEIDSLVGVNYWVSVGGSTELWSGGTAKPAVAVLTKYFQPAILKGYVKNDLDNPVRGAIVASRYRRTTTDRYGYFKVPVAADLAVSVSAEGYHDQSVIPAGPDAELSINLHKESEGLFFRFLKSIKQ